jgi:hypothetical protein
MPPYSMEQTVMEGDATIKAIYLYVQEHAEDFDAYRMEKGIRKRINELAVVLMKLYFAAKGTGDVGKTLTLEDGTVLKRESELRERSLFSVFGKLAVPRTCYRVKGRAGIMPLDAQANLPDRSYSYLLQEYMDLLGITDPFDQSSDILEKLTGLKVWSNRFEAVSRTSCANYDQYYDAKPLPSPESEGAIAVVSFDGKGVPVIKSEAAKIVARKGKGKKSQKKKEAMVGVSYSIDPNPRTPEQVAKNLVYPDNEKDRKTEGEKPRARNIRRLASLERSKEEVFHEIVDDSRKRNPDKSKLTVAVMDGALSLWGMLIAVMAGAPYVGILDIIHVVEYLWKVANALYNEGSDLGRKWVYDNLLLILQGRVDRVIEKMERLTENKKLKKSKRDTLNDCIRYYVNHCEWMKYDEYLEAGYPIGSGVVESSCGHTVKNRMEGTGRRWSVDGAEAILLLRSVYTSRDWEEFWQFHMELERSFNYHDALASIGTADTFNELGMVEGKSPVVSFAA